MAEGDVASAVRNAIANTAAGEQSTGFATSLFFLEAWTGKLKALEEHAKFEEGAEHVPKLVDAVKGLLSSDSEKVKGRAVHILESIRDSTACDEKTREEIGKALSARKVKI